MTRRSHFSHIVHCVKTELNNEVHPIQSLLNTFQRDVSKDNCISFSLVATPTECRGRASSSLQMSSRREGNSISAPFSVKPSGVEQKVAMGIPNLFFFKICMQDHAGMHHTNKKLLNEPGHDFSTNRIMT